MVLILIWVLGVPGLVAVFAAAWKGWRGGAAVAGILVLLACGMAAMVLLQPRPHTDADAYGRGQSLVYLEAFTVFALAGVLGGAVIGLTCRWLALRARPPMLEVEHTIQTARERPE
jgi:hypothetical protein